jgi:hypothetical protein
MAERWMRNVPLAASSTMMWDKSIGMILSTGP